VLVARSPRALQRILWRPGELGLARAYVSGDLDVEGDLTEGLRRVHAAAPRPGPFGLIKTGPAAVAAAGRLGLFAPPPEPPRCELRVHGRQHSRTRDQAVIAGHYDVPSAFYQLILDQSMAYSCAYWDPQTVDLGAAQRAKLELIGRKLALEPGQSLLDMGCGWGSLTIHAARARVRVTGVTLSREQGGYVRRRARGLGLNLQVRIQDYRDPLDGPYDAIASVEMGEHVGAARYPAFCAALYSKLRPGGRLLIQQMSRTTRRGGGPFIESYIAPDMDMRPVGETIRLIQDAGFEVIGVEAMREHYARTIRAWLENFEANLPAITTILTAEQVRVWRLYLAGGALAFEQGRMGVDQILAVKPEGPRR
jgi:cyclopropane-fatty-acyl-phospholipid synthase